MNLYKILRYFWLKVATDYDVIPNNFITKEPVKMINAKIMRICLINTLFLINLLACQTQKQLDLALVSPAKHDAKQSIVCMGNEPFWKLTTDRDSFYLQTIEGGKMAFYRTETLAQKDTTRIVLQAKDKDNQTITLELFPEKCMDSMSGELFDNKAKLIWKNHIWEGCARQK